jgi:hypothetical protein
VNFSRIGLGVIAAALVALVAAPGAYAQVGPTPPGASPAPTPVPTGGPRRGRRAPRPAASGSPGATPSETPEPPQFTTLDGTWELELQPPLQRLADYSYLSIVAKGANLTGTWVHGAKQIHSPMTGTFDGRLISMTVTLPDGSSANFAGYVENFDNMVGMYRTSDKDPGTAFTGEHRKKIKT